MTAINRHFPVFPKITPVYNSTPTDEQISFYVRAYLYLSKKQKKIIRYLYGMHQSCPSLYMRVSEIIGAAGCSETTYKDFFRGAGAFMFEKVSKFDKNGWQRSNTFIFNKKFLMALRWLDIYGKLQAPRSKYEQIISSIEKEEKPPPDLGQKPPPLIKDSLLSKKKDNYVAGNMLLRGEKIPEEAKIYLSSRFSDHILIEMLNSFRYNKSRKLIRTTDQAWMIGVAKRLQKDYQCRKNLNQ